MYDGMNKALLMKMFEVLKKAIILTRYSRKHGTYLHQYEHLQQPVNIDYALLLKCKRIVNRFVLIMI